MKTKMQKINVKTISGENLIINSEELGIFFDIACNIKVHKKMLSRKYALSRINPHGIKIESLTRSPDFSLEEITRLLDKNDIAKTLIESKKHTIEEEKSLQGFLSLQEAYKFIATGKPINKHNMQELFEILDNGFDSIRERRPERVYPDDMIFTSVESHLYSLARPALKTEKSIDSFLEYINNTENLTMVDHLFNIILINFYFLNSQKGFVTNSKYARTVALWYILNNKAYPFTMFSEVFTRLNSHHSLDDKSKNMNFTVYTREFLKRILPVIAKEKTYSEYTSGLNISLSSLEEEIIYILASLPEELHTVFHISQFYSRYNPEKTSQEIYEKRIHPLEEKGILESTPTKKGKNMTLSLKNKKIKRNIELGDI